MKTLIVLLVAAGVVIPLRASGEVPLATSSEVTFAYNSLESSPFGLSSVNAFAPVTWQTLETVSVTAPDGTTTIEASNASIRGSFTFTPTVGGVWTISNSMSGTVKVCVPWSVLGDSTNVTSSAAMFMADTVEDGPDRMVKSRREMLPVAYSGDGWIGDVTKASTLTFTPPGGSGLSPTVFDLAGQGAQSFTINACGEWTVLLTFADGATLSSRINYWNGFVLSFR